MITGYDHVQVAMERGREDAARSFYGGLLGMRELAKPPVLAARGGCWFAAGDAVLHLGVEEPFRPARKAHPAFLVEDLERLRADRRRPWRRPSAGRSAAPTAAWRWPARRRSRAAAG